MALAGFAAGDERFLNNWFIGSGNLDSYGGGGGINLRRRKCLSAGCFGEAYRGW